MEPKSLVCHEDRTVELTSVTLPSIGPKDILIQALYSGVSIGTERNLIKNNVSWGSFPICTGYQAVGIIEEVGNNVEEYDVGDEVYYTENSALQLEDGTDISPTSGTHSSYAVVNVKESPVGHLPPDVSANVASTFVMPAVGLNGVNKANVQLGDVVAVHGVGLVGLGVVGAARHRGAEVIAIDLQQNRLTVADSLGADHTIHASNENVHETVKEISPEGADVVFESTGIPDCIDIATRLCKQSGKFVFQGDYGEEPITFSERTLNEKQLNGFFPAGFSGKVGAQAVLKNMANGALPWGHTITHRITPMEAPDVYNKLVDEEYENILGVVIDWNKYS